VDTDLFDAASGVRARAHVPYSRFRVGVAIRTAAGNVHVGTNVENASYPEGSCAETAAIAAMVAAAEPGEGRRIELVCVVADRIDGRLTTPCGGCRQRLAEFGTPATLVIASDPAGGFAAYRLGELLPAAFAMEQEP